MKASGKMSVGRFEEEFEKEFGVRIEVKVGKSLADNKATLASLRPKDYSGPKNSTFEISGRMHVKNVKAKINKVFGIQVDLYDGGRIAPGDITLKSLRAGSFKKQKTVETSAKNDVEETVETENGSAEEIEITFKGFGYELQYHRLTEEDIDELRESYDQDKSEFFEERLTGGDGFFGESIWGGSFGPTPEGIELFIDDEPLETSNISFNETDFISDEDKEEDVVDYIYYQEGKVFGSIFIDLKIGEVFDPSKLKIEYMKFELDGWAEKYGSIIHSFSYDGEDCYFEVEDNGLQNFKYLISYAFEDGDYEEDLVLYDTENDDSESINWALLEEA